MSDEQKIEENKLLKQKKGRPMMDTNVIYDEVNDRYYDPYQDPLEYRKARK
jgi:hypothetical protein